MFGGNGVTGAVLAVGYYALFLGSGMYIGRRLLCKERYSIVMQYLVGSVAGVWHYNGFLCFLPVCLIFR